MKSVGARIGVLSAVIVAAQLVGLAPARAAGGDPVPSFGFGGWFGASDAASSPHRKIFADPSGFGQLAIGGAVFVFDSHGQGDNSVAAPGISFMTDATQDSQGRTLLLGEGPGGSLRVARISGDQLDATFGGGSGVVDLPMDWRASLIAAAVDGSVAVAGGAEIAKLTPSGALDTTWNPSGVTPGIAPQSVGVAALAFQSSGALIIVCTVGQPQGLPCLTRFTADGQPDASFGSDGMAPGPDVDASHQLAYRSLALGSDDQIYVGGADMSDQRAMIAAFASNGTRSPLWHGTGVVVESDQQTIVESLLVTPQGGLFAGSVGLVSNNSMTSFVDLYSSTGYRACSFAHCGIDPLAPHGGGVSSQVHVENMALAPDGSLLVADNADYHTGWAYDLATDGIPQPVGITATPTSAGIVVRWTNPASVTYASTSVYVQNGLTPPCSIGVGQFVYGGLGTSFTVAAPPGVDRSICLFGADYNATPAAPIGLVFHGTHFTGLSPATATYGATHTFSATLRRTDGSRVSGVAVGVYVRRHGTSTWTKRGAVTSSSSGVAAIRLPATVTTDVQFRFGGAHTDLASTATTVLTVAPAVTATWSRTTAPPGATVTVTGKVAPNAHGQSVYLQRLDGRSWRNVARLTLSPVSTYTLAYRLTSRGHLVFRVYRPADSSHAAGATPRVVVTVS